MNVTKQTYLSALRANTAYPTYRGVIGVITIILMVQAGLVGLGSLVFGLTMMSQQGFAAGFFALLIGLAVAALAFFMAKFWNEAALILADIGDSVIETNASASTFNR